jgi:hypothetical protein
MDRLLLAGDSIAANGLSHWSCFVAGFFNLTRIMLQDKLGARQLQNYGAYTHT